MSFFLLRVPVIRCVLSTDVLIDSYKALHISFLLPCKNCVRLIHESVLVCQYVPRLSGAKDRTQAPEEVTRSVVQWIPTTHTNNNNYCRYLLTFCCYLSSEDPVTSRFTVIGRKEFRMISFLFSDSLEIILL